MPQGLDRPGGDTLGISAAPTAEAALAAARGEIERRDEEIKGLRRRLAEALAGAPPGVPRHGGEASADVEAARFHAVADTVPHLLWISNPTGDWTWANRRWTEHTGMSSLDARGLGWLEAVHPDDREGTMEAWRAADANGELRVEHRLRGADGRHRWFSTRALPRRWNGPSDRCAFWCGTSTDVEAGRRTEAALRESEARFRGFAEASPAVLWITGGEGGGLDYVSPAFEQIWGEEREAALRDRGLWADRLHPDDRAAVLATLPRLRQGERLPVEYRIRRRSDGAVRWIRDIGFPIRDAEGRVSRIAGLALDISDQREAEERQRLLLNELNHRVKNALAGVQALAAQALRGQNGPQTPKAFVRAFGDRLFALARAHDLLTREAWQGAPLSEVVWGTLSPHEGGAGAGADPGRVAASGPEVRLTPNAAVALHMAFHELATNAAEHGALTAREGRVEVEWSVARGAAEAGPDRGSVLEIHWRERGGPTVSGPPERRGFGSRLIERGLSRQLGGETRLDFLPDGVECSLRLPLSARVEAGK